MLNQQWCIWGSPVLQLNPGISGKRWQGHYMEVQGNCWPSKSPLTHSQRLQGFIIWSGQFVGKGETSTESLSLIAANDPLSCAIYSKKNKFIDLPRWKRLKELAKRPGQLFRLINQVKFWKFGNKTKFNYGFEIPRNHKHATEIDKQNGITLWQDATELELKSMAAYEFFKTSVIRKHLLLSTKPFECT